MDSLNDCVKEYTIQLGKGQIQKAYRGIMTFMSDLKSPDNGPQGDSDSLESS